MFWNKKDNSSELWVAVHYEWKAGSYDGGDDDEDINLMHACPTDDFTAKAG